MTRHVDIDRAVMRLLRTGRASRLGNTPAMNTLFIFATIIFVGLLENPL